MKKLFVIFILGAIFLIASCGGSSKKENSNENPDSDETVTDEDGDTADEEPADAEPAEDSDKDGGDTADDSGDSKPDEDSTPEPTEADQCVAVGGTWNWDGKESSCVKTVSCKKITAGHAEWNGHDSYTQKYADGKWSSEVPTKYDETKGDCHFKCAANYLWNGKDCLSECNILTTDFPCYDPESKLTWSEKYPNMEWVEASKYCQKLNGSSNGGRGIGWDLPTIDELKTLIVGWSKDESCKISAENDCLAYGNCWTNDLNCAESCKEVDGSVECIPDPKFSKFGDGGYNEYLWSSSVMSDYSGYAWILYSYYGYIYYSYTTNELPFRCVWIEPDEIAAECVENGGIWDRVQKKCTISCGTKPEHSLWNGDNHYAQEYSEGVWTPEITAEYNDETEGTCHFKCAENYSWESGKCVLTANENIDTVPEDQNNNVGATCDPATFVEFCDENDNTIWCDSGTVTAFSCTSIGKTCITTIDLYDESKIVNAAYCASPCETPGKKPLSCRNNPVGSGGILTADLCLKTSKGYLAFEGVVSQCNTPCNEEGTDCIPLNKVPDDQNSVTGATCDFDTFVEFCDGSVAKWCSYGAVYSRECGDSCLEVMGVYGGGYEGKNYADCLSSCGTAGEMTGTPNCGYEDEESVFGSMNRNICLATSKGNRLFYNVTYEQCTTPCDAYGDECLPECSDNGVTPCYDSESGLTWSGISSSYISWTGTDSSGTVTYPAKEHCEGLEEGGFDDWRLPNIDELRTLLVADRIKNNCKVSETAECLSYADCWSCSECTETAVQSSESSVCANWDYSEEDIYSKLGDKKINLWSSSLLSDKPQNVWYIDFDYGAVDNLPQINDGVYVRCVR